MILLLAADKNASSFMAPLPIGLALFVAELASGTFASESLADFPPSPSLFQRF